jgi:glycosyltransferase involved in cell wall biosynthesis
LKAHEVELLVIAHEPSSISPFSEELFSWLRQDRLVWWKNGQVNARKLIQELNTFKPNVILCSGWAISEYLKAISALQSPCTRILCFDTPWLGTSRQWLGRLWARLRLKPLFDLAFVPGERQYQMAIRLWFMPHQIIQGLLAPDTAAFASSGETNETNRSARQCFLYVGRLSQEKGVKILIEAYRHYREASGQPWPLHIAGTGPLASELNVLTGVVGHGFVQPAQLPSLMHQSGCLVVPSLYEPWGVQISEAATAGLPIIATTACGSAVHLVQSQFNGYLIPPGDVDALADALQRMERNPNLSGFACNSKRLAGQFTPELWAWRLLSACLSERAKKC